jgi:AraC-like DNA-binding protein
MAGSCSTAHTDNGGARIEIVQTAPASAASRLATVTLGSLRLVLLEPGAPCIAFVSLVPTSVFISLSADGASDEITLHGLGEAFHVRSDEPGKLALISIGRRDFARYTRALLGTKIEAPPSARFLRLPAAALRDIRRLQAQALRLGTTKPALLARRGVERALEQDLLHVLLDGLGAAEARRPPRHRRHADIATRFEKLLAASDRLPSLPKLCATLDVPERTLRLCCKVILGCSPMTYARLRRLNHAHVMLAQADPEATSVAKIARQCGFTQPGRFSIAYRKVFGEMPSQTVPKRLSTSAESA